VRRLRPPRRSSRSAAGRSPGSSRDCQTAIPAIGPKPTGSAAPLPIRDTGSRRRSDSGALLRCTRSRVSTYSCGHSPRFSRASGTAREQRAMIRPVWTTARPMRTGYTGVPFSSRPEAGREPAASVCRSGMYSKGGTMTSSPAPPPVPRTAVPRGSRLNRIHGRHGIQPSRVRARSRLDRLAVAKASRTSHI